MFSSFNNKKIIITGHTGFKGAWLTLWLTILGAKVVGLALRPHTNPSLFNALNIENDIQNINIDIRDAHKVAAIFETIQPDFVFHLAAQSLVIKSYEDPRNTWTTNLIGTISVLEGLRKLKNNCTAIFITSDKCYENMEWIWGYRETDRLGGIDPYSASKGAAEIAIRSYIKSFFLNDGKVRIATARAGNVIGGGDWSDDRIIPDCIRSWTNGQIVQLRSPLSTRPWQHVLEPLSGYLLLASELSQHALLHSEPFNFGPSSNENHSVLELVKEMAIHWEKVSWSIPSELNALNYESLLLRLNCDKANILLKWNSAMNFNETVKMTIEWYKNFYKKDINLKDFTIKQIESYTLIAQDKNLSWTKSLI